MIDEPHLPRFVVRRDAHAAHSSRSRSNPIRLPSDAAMISRMRISVLAILHPDRSETI
jgi:hypothetical protein